jgi:hypothetical protein
MSNKKRETCTIKNYHELTEEDVSMIDERHYPFIQQVGESLYNRHMEERYGSKQVMPGLPMHPRDRMISAQFNIMHQGRFGPIIGIDLILIIARRDSEGNYGNNRYYLKELTGKDMSNKRGRHDE